MSQQANNETALDILTNFEMMMLEELDKMRTLITSGKRKDTLETRQLAVGLLEGTHGLAFTRDGMKTLTIL